MTTVLGGAFVGHALAGFFFGGIMFCFGHWMASRTYGKAFAELERKVQAQGALLNSFIERGPWGI